MQEFDKRTTQVVLPFKTDVSEPVFKDYVKQHWNVTFARQKKVSVYAKRIMALVLSQIKEDESKLRPFYRIHISHIETEAEVSLDIAYKQARMAIDQLTDIKWHFEDIKNRKYVPKHLLSTTTSEEKEGFESGYSNGWFTIVLNPALEKHFVELAHYSTYQLKHYMTFKSWYSMRLFEILSAFKDTGYWIVGLEEYRLLMDCSKKYPDTKDLLDRTLTEPLEELKNTKLAFTYEPFRNEAKLGKGRKPIIGLQFKLKHVEAKHIPKSWFEYSDEHKRVLLELMQFKVTEKNIAKYAKAIGIVRAKKLLRDWKLKEISNNRINDKERYCNFAWVQEGKAASGID